MNHESALRGAFTVVAFLTVGISGYHRYRARRLAGTIPRRAEPLPLIIGKLAVAVPAYTVVLGYMIHPPWVAWAQLALPLWLRWSAVAVAALLVPMSYWIFRSLGTNVSETVLTKEHHTLVTWGPYRWVRHPLYAAAFAGFVALSIVAANWFLLLMLALFLPVLPAIVRREEAMLLQKFGPAYEEYMARTGRFVPRLRA